jgi:hypothetical protein
LALAFVVGGVTVKILQAWIVCLILVLAPQRSLAGPGPSPSYNNGEEISMVFARQADDPIRIVQASFGADNLLLDARLENKSHQKIQTYRLGWAVVKKDDVRIGKGGDLVTVPEGVDTTSTFDIPGQAASAKEDLAKHPTGIMFYVAELQFQDGTKWQADPKKVKKEAAAMIR